MTTAELFCSRSQIDLESGGIPAPERRRRPSSAAMTGYETPGSLCSGESEEEDDDHSSYSHFYSTAGGSIDGISFGGGGGWSSRRVSSDSELSVGSEAVEIKVHLGKVERICRICHLNLEDENGQIEEFGAPIELGCSCKDDLGTAHKNCAETWFKIKGNKTCEICHSTARNVMSSTEIVADPTQQSSENASNSTAEPSSALVAPEPQRFWQGNRFLNFLLACMVFAFVISWLFHFKVPS